MPDSDESCRIIRPASHTSALGLVFIAENGAGAQGGCYGKEKFTELVALPHATLSALVASYVPLYKPPDVMREFREPSASPLRCRHDRLGPWTGFLVSIAIVCNMKAHE